LFSIKEIFKESIGVLIIASVIGLIAGLFLRSVQDRLLVILPLIIILPALNGMIGDFGMIMISRFSTALYEKKINKDGVHSKIIKHLFKEVIPISIFSAIYISVLATLISHLRGFAFNALNHWYNFGYNFNFSFICIYCRCYRKHLYLQEKNGS